jgi:hypothetical protein
MVPESKKLAIHLNGDPAIVLNGHEGAGAVLRWFICPGELRLDEVGLMPRRVKGAAFQPTVGTKGAIGLLLIVGDSV